MKQMLPLFITITVMTQLNAQNPNDYYYEIPSYPESYTAGTTVARMMDGLGFRYYWVTAGLQAEDLAFKPIEESRSTEEIIDHIYDLTRIVMNATQKLPNDFIKKNGELTFKQKREATLLHIKTASTILTKSSNKEMELYKMIFVRSKGTTTYPFWNQLNGPIADALWHTGQIAAFRRLSGNPFPDGVNVLTGKKGN